MQLHQINVGYDPLQDRLLVRISTTDKVEYRLWLTRRLLKGFWGGLVQLMQSTELARRQAAPEARQAVVEFQRQQALSEAKFGERYEVEKVQPAVPGEPMLVSAVRMQPKPGGGHGIAFLPHQGQGFHVHVTDALLHAFAKLLQDALTKTDWDLALNLPATALPAERKLN